MAFEENLKTRTDLAMSAIKRVFGPEDDECGATLFVSHHLEELDSSYWRNHLGTASPSPEEVLSILELVPPFDGDLDSLDFTLPGEVTNYLICVSFDQSGAVEDISMES